MQGRGYWLPGNLNPNILFIYILLINSIDSCGGVLGTQGLVHARVYHEDTSGATKSTSKMESAVGLNHSPHRTATAQGYLFVSHLFSLPLKISLKRCLLDIMANFI